MTADGDRSTRDRTSAVLRLLADPDRSPVFAAIGAGDVIRSAAADTVRNVREDMRQRRNDAADTFTLAFGRLPRNLDEFVHQLGPAELRKRAEHCGRFGLELYEFLAARGEIAVDKVQSELEVPYQDRKLDVGTVGVRLAVAAAEDLRTLASRLLDRTDASHR